MASELGRPKPGQACGEQAEVWVLGGWEDFTEMGGGEGGLATGPVIGRAGVPAPQE